MEKLQSRIIAGKKVSSKEFGRINENFLKEFDKLKQEISKEFLNFMKKVQGLLYKEPPWFRYRKKELQWKLESPNLIEKLNICYEKN